MPIESLQEAIAIQAEIIQFLACSGVRDLVGDYGELLAHEALGGLRKNAVNRGFDLKHPEFQRIEVKTRKYELMHNSTVRKENRAVGFKGKENGFDWLLHIVLDVDFSIVGACLVSYQDVWPEIQRTNGKIGFAKSSRLPSSKNITEQIREAQLKLGFRNS